MSQQYKRSALQPRHPWLVMAGRRARDLVRASSSSETDLYRVAIHVTSYDVDAIHDDRVLVTRVSTLFPQGHGRAAKVERRARLFLFLRQFSAPLFLLPNSHVD